MMATNREKKSLAWNQKQMSDSKSSERARVMKRRRETCEHRGQTEIDTSGCLICSFCEMVLHDPFYY